MKELKRVWFKVHKNAFLLIELLVSIALMISGCSKDWEEHYDSARDIVDVKLAKLQIRLVLTNRQQKSKKEHL